MIYLLLIIGFWVLADYINNPATGVKLRMLLKAIWVALFLGMWWAASIIAQVILIDAASPWYFQIYAFLGVVFVATIGPSLHWIYKKWLAYEEKKAL